MTVGAVVGRSITMVVGRLPLGSVPLFTPNVTEKLPVTVGAPEIKPVAVSRVTPAGRAPAVTPYVTLVASGAIMFKPVMLALNGAPPNPAVFDMTRFRGGPKVTLIGKVAVPIWGIAGGPLVELLALIVTFDRPKGPVGVPAIPPVGLTVNPAGSPVAP